MNPLFPSRLMPGATIGIVTVSAPEAATEPEWYGRGTAYLQQRGHRIRASESVSARHGYLSAPEQQLARELVDQFRDPEIAAIICAGGGTNANRLLRHLDFGAIAEHPKIFMGSSNPTVLLNAIYAKCGLVTFHGPAVVWNFGNPSGLTDYTESNLNAVLMEPRARTVFEARPAWRWLRPGHAEGPLLGGNLISLQTLLGTPYEPNWEGAILFWEDIGKSTNRLDLMLTHFRDAGVFDRISGMVVGQLVGCDPPDGGQTLEEMLEEVLGDYRFPVLQGVEFGHTDDKLTLPIGGHAELGAGDILFALSQPAVR
jgi:muramoyltetrapeptide carboxypeptidase